MGSINESYLLKDIVSGIPEGIFLCDEDYKIVYVNKALEEITGQSKDNLLTLKCSDFIVLDKVSCPICSSNLENPISPEKYMHQGIITDKDSNKIPVKITHKVITASENGKNLILTTVSSLADSICLNQAHVDFVSTVSHELRTPLTSIKGFADTLLNAGDMLPKEQQVRFISIIKSQVDRLTRLVEDLLTVSRLESKKDNSIYKSLDIEKVIEPIVQGIETKAPEHTFKVEIPEDLPEIWADSDKLEQVLTNLIDNAAKYSYKNTTVTVKASYTLNNTDYIDIKIIDQGVGIPKELLPKMFTKFSRIDNPLTREVQGTGLGLYITKSLVEKMKGEISVDSNEKGSTFTVKLPVATCEKQTSQKFS